MPTGCLESFRSTGIVRLDGAFSTEQAAAMRDTVWRYLEHKVGGRPDDPSSWPAPGAISYKGLRRNTVFAPFLDNPATGRLLDELFGEGAWHPVGRGAQVLFSFPTGMPWTLSPGGWHMDAGFDLATWPLPTVRIFALIGEVAPSGGGTLFLAGSHRVVERYARTLPPGTAGNMGSWGKFMRHHPWLATIDAGADDPESARRLVGRTEEVDGVPVQLVELSGSPGDLVVTHLHVFHRASPDATDLPRQMLSRTVSAGADLPGPAEENAHGARPRGSPPAPPAATP